MSEIKGVVNHSGQGVGVVTEMPMWKEARVVVIGAGISGILAGLQAKERGCHVRILEKGGDLGGVWHHNRYPGVACDTTAHTYVYSFAPEAEFTRRVAPGADVKKYYKSVAKRFDLERLVSYNKEVVSCVWDGAAWNLKTADGESLVAEIVIAATGRLHHPVFPDIPGLSNFQGNCVHTSQWDETLDLSGKRVGIIGTGSTAAQVNSVLSRIVKKLTVFQRTPQWVMSMPNWDIPADQLDKLKADPAEPRRYFDQLLRDIERDAQAQLLGDEAYVRKVKESIYKGLDSVSDSELRRKLTPNYEIGCKRMVISDDFYDVMQRPNVELEIEKIASIESNGVRLIDGRFHELDALIIATGFKTDAIMRPMKLRGVDGISIDDVWEEDLVCYRSVAIPSMPNFFMINGPFSAGGRVSYTTWIEIQSLLVNRMVEKVLKDRVALMPTLAASIASVEHIRARVNGTVLVKGGCQSWALDAKGRALVDYPDPKVLEDEMRTASFADFEEFPLKPLLAKQTTESTSIS